MPTARTISGPNPYRDPRHRFELGRPVICKTVVPRLTAELGDGVEARFRVGAMCHDHLSGRHGAVSASDAEINRFLLDQHARGKSKRCIYSTYIVGSIRIEVITHLGANETVIRVAD